MLVGISDAVITLESFSEGIITFVCIWAAAIKFEGAACQDAIAAEGALVNAIRVEGILEDTISLEGICELNIIVNDTNVETINFIFG